MQSKSLTKLTLKASALPLALLIFLASHSSLNAQAFYAANTVNPGPASFSKNWDISTGKTYEPKVASSQPLHPRVTTAVAAPAAPVVYSALVVQGNVSTPSLPGNSSGPTVPGYRAVVRHGIAYAPAEAPLAVKKAIWATNTICGRPYVWGGGHDSFSARGYDCSGTVSFALHYAGQLGSPTDSHSLMSFGEPGRGRWMTIYAGRGHTWMEIAGLRLDTTGNYGNEGPGWRTDSRSPWGYTVRHPAGL